MFQEEGAKWVRITKYSEMDINFALEIHVHGAEDLQPGSWNHGKFGSGQAVEIR